VSYATLDEFLRRLRLESPTPEAEAAAQQCLDAATQEIDSYLGWPVVTPLAITPEQEALVVIVNLDRAFEHWRNTPFGALNTGPDFPPVLTARDSWYRHARKLASLKTSWGVG
jgi:hypothetical protein